MGESERRTRAGERVAVCGCLWRRARARTHTRARPLSPASRGPPAIRSGRVSLALASFLSIVNTAFSRGVRIELSVRPCRSDDLFSLTVCPRRRAVHVRAPSSSAVAEANCSTRALSSGLRNRVPPNELSARRVSFSRLVTAPLATTTTRRSSRPERVFSKLGPTRAMKARHDDSPVTRDRSLLARADL